MILSHPILNRCVGREKGYLVKLQSWCPAINLLFWIRLIRYGVRRVCVFVLMCACMRVCLSILYLNLYSSACSIVLFPNHLSKGIYVIVLTRGLEIGPPVVAPNAH